MKVNRNNNNIMICIKIGDSAGGCTSARTLAQAKKIMNGFEKRGFLINVMESDYKILDDIENCIPAKSIKI